MEILKNEKSRFGSPLRAATYAVAYGGNAPTWARCLRMANSIYCREKSLGNADHFGSKP